MLRIIFIILGGIVAINSILTTIKWKETSRFRKLLTLVSILLVLIGSYYTWADFKESKINKSIDSRVGKLNTTNYNKENLSIKFNIGGETIIQSDDGYFKFPGGENKGNFFNAWINNNKLFLNIVIRNEIGEIIATIDGQTWKLYNTEYDYNNDDKGFEIVTPDRKVVFQIFLREGFVFIRGLVMSDKKIGWYIMEESNGIYRTTLNMVVPKQFQFEIPNQVPKIFKYPRETNYGVRDLINTLNK